MDSKKIKVLLLGTGAVGSFYGGKLFQGGAEVSVVSRSDFDIVKERGINIKSVLGDFHFKPHRVMKSGAEYGEKPDYIIVTTKVLPEVDVYTLIKDVVVPGTSIVLLQNGIDVEKGIAEKFPDNEIISALAFICVSRFEYGEIDHQDYGRLVIGRYPGGNSEKVRVLENIFAESGISVESTDDVITARWRKLLWNAPFNPLSVICGGADTSEMLGNPYVRELCVGVMKEIVKLSRADGHPLEESLITKNIEDTEKMIPYKTSMLLDYENRRPMEVEAIAGNALKIAFKYDIDTPLLKMTHAVLSILNEKNLMS